MHLVFGGGIKNMKYILSIILAMATTIYASSRDEQGHVLSEMWKVYYKAREKDMVKDQVKALEKIIEEAEEKDLSWDFYDAWDKYVETQASINWKTRQEYEQKMDVAIKAFNDATLCFFHNKEGEEFIEEHKEELKSSYSPEFYDRDYRIYSYSFGKALAKLLRSDYDYACWANGHNSTDAYPLDALYELYQIQSDSEPSRERFEAFALKHKGRAVALLAEDELINMSFSELQKRDASEEDYLCLRRDCEALLKKMYACKADEKLIAECGNAAQRVLDRLMTEKVEMNIEEGVMELIFRNRKSARIRIYREGSRTKPVFDRLVLNKQGRFYLKDSVSLQLPDLDDGEYEIRLDADWKQLTYSKHMLSIALRSYSGQDFVYVADAVSGKPVEKCKISLYDTNDFLVWEQDEFSIDGFTKLPSEIRSSIKEGYYGYHLRASLNDKDGKMRSSNEINIYAHSRQNSEAKQQSALLLTDRSAFNPGETVKFKAVLYERGKELRAMGSKIKLEAVLKDPQGKTIERKSLISNEFSSVEGSFTLKKTDRGGSYRISIEKGGQSLAAKYITVDEFVLPSFDLEWEKTRRSWLPGEEIELRGRAFSYAGRNLGNADISYSVKKNGEVIDGGKLSVSKDGRFIISFKSEKSDNYAFYSISVKISEFSGETLEFSTGANVSPAVHLFAEIVNKTEGRASGEAYYDYEIVSEDSVRVKCSCDLPYSYALFKDGDCLVKGDVNTDEILLELKGFESGIYTLKLGGENISEREIRFYYVADGLDSIDKEIDCFFMEVPGELAVLSGSGKGPVWMVAELHGGGNRLLERKLIYSSLSKIEFQKQSHYPAELKISIFYFKNYSSYEYSADYRNELTRTALPVSISRFSDKTLPGSSYSVKIQTEAGVECAASIFDISSEQIRENRWFELYPYSSSEISLETWEQSGCNSSAGGFLLHDNMVVGYGSKMLMSRAAESSVETLADEEETVQARQSFLESLAWEPLLRSDEKGEISFEFETSDKLSIYAIQLFAHDKQMRNAVLRQEFSVSLPVQINVSQPQYLYEGDIFVANIEIQNSSDKELSGRLSLDFGKGEKRLPASIPEGGSFRFSQEIVAETPGELEILAKFSSDSGAASDAVLIKIPVREAIQSLKEAHSALIGQTKSKDELISELASRFVNVDAKQAIYKEISIADMLKDELPEQLNCESDNSISLSESLLADYLLREINGQDSQGLSAKDRAEIIEKLLACHKGDGGFAWFSGMRSSLYTTAAVLENLAAMRKGLPKELEAIIAAALLYMHKECDVDDELYLYMRALYSDVELEKAKIPARILRKYADNRAGNILSKARKIFVLKSFGYNKQADQELESLSQYAVEHSSGGMYFPNAVMPWRGLMESELHAHTLLCRILDSYGYDQIAEGLRLWMMVQKESQQWGSDPAFLAAAATILEAEESTLNSKIAILSAESSLPFSKISESGNGFRISTSYFLNGKALREGDSIKPGDKVKARYELWSEENRSFVKICVPRPAALRPVQQLSGMQGYAAYRSVEAERSCYWFDNYPEEKLILEEEFFVVQEGRFCAAAATIESLYAPHYRANSDPISDFSVMR